MRAASFALPHFNRAYSATADGCTSRAHRFAARTPSQFATGGFSNVKTGIMLFLNIDVSRVVLLHHMRWHIEIGGHFAHAFAVCKHDACIM